MNTLVEKGLGIMIFLFFFVPYTLGLYDSTMKAYEFNNVTNELTQMVKEDGGYTNTGRAKKYASELTKTVTKNINGTNQQVEEGYKMGVYKKITRGDYNTAYANASTRSQLKLFQNGKEIPLQASVPSGTVSYYRLSNTKEPAGTKLLITYNYDKESIFGWHPKYEKMTTLTVYRR